MAKPKKPFVVVRATQAGVHVGTLEGRKGQEVTLSNARRLWRWRGANTLNEVALRGVSDEWTRLSEPVGSVTILDACEVIETSKDGAANLSRSRWAS